MPDSHDKSRLTEIHITGYATTIIALVIMCLALMAFSAHQIIVETTLKEQQLVLLNALSDCRITATRDHTRVETFERLLMRTHAGTIESSVMLYKKEKRLDTIEDFLRWVNGT